MNTTRHTALDWLHSSRLPSLPRGYFTMLVAVICHLKLQNIFNIPVTIVQICAEQIIRLINSDILLFDWIRTFGNTKGIWSVVNSELISVSLWNTLCFYSCGLDWLTGHLCHNTDRIFSRFRFYCPLCSQMESLFFLNRILQVCSKFSCHVKSMFV